ncbi:MAG: Transcriptional regulator of various polyols utilization, AraC family [Rhodanobacteraceae bacterium]|jgi:AraC-like DNA-binding protein|nr:MAG: Transcriptional regulator of various polyols utilization, AraC family [Rhodanobacteraceae bacterium]
MVQAMATLRAVWIDFCHVPRRHGLFVDAQQSCNVLRVTLPEAIPAAIRGHRAQFVCIEYDYPDQARLRAVPMVRREFPALPLLMLTEYHSEALALWAFRSRVWDYRVKPVDQNTLARLFEAMVHAGNMAANAGWLADPFPSDLIAPAGHLRRPLIAAPHTTAAIAYISEHYAEACRIETIAGVCHLSESEFSRVFHREHGVSFRRFLLQYRIAKARDFLAEPCASVSQVAYAVGFNDLSHFGRMFRRIVGMPATHYQRNLRIGERPIGEMKISLPRAESFHSIAARF